MARSARPYGRVPPRRRREPSSRQTDPCRAMAGRRLLGLLLVFAALLGAGRAARAGRGRPRGRGGRGARCGVRMIAAPGPAHERGPPPPARVTPRDAPPEGCSGCGSLAVGDSRAGYLPRLHGVCPGRAHGAGEVHPEEGLQLGFASPGDHLEEGAAPFGPHPAQSTPAPQRMAGCQPVLQGRATDDPSPPPSPDPHPGPAPPWAVGPVPAAMAAPACVG